MSDNPEAIEGEPSELISEQVENQEATSLPKTLTQDHFWKAIAGEEPYEPPSRGQLEKIAHKQIEQNSPPLTDLNQDEMDVLNESFMRSLKLNTSSQHLEELVYLVTKNRLCFFPVIDEPKRIWPRVIRSMPVEGLKPTFYEYIADFDLDRDPKNTDEEIDLPRARQLAAEYNISMKPMSRQQVIGYLTDPKIWGEAIFSRGWPGRTSSPLTAQGIRPLSEYGYSEERTKKIFARIREQTGHQKLKVLDIGGGSGYTLSEIQEIDPDIETINLTIDEEPTSFGVDKLLLLPAELMPKDLEESVDFAVSRTAFRYFPFPDIALKNVLKSLTIGGYADIEFATERSALRKVHPEKSEEEIREELDQRVRSVLLWIKRLEREGYIETNIPDEDLSQDKKYEHANGFSLRYGKYYRDTSGFIHITKVKSIKGLKD